MQEFRRFVRGPVGKVLLAAIILPFVISGFYGYFTGGGSGDVVAEVEGNKITRSMVNQRVERVRDMLRQQSPNIDPSMLDSFVRPEMVLEGLVNEQLILAAAQNANLAFSETQAARDVLQPEVPLNTAVEHARRLGAGGERHPGRGHRHADRLRRLHH